MLFEYKCIFLIVNLDDRFLIPLIECYPSYLKLKIDWYTNKGQTSSIVNERNVVSL